MAIMGKMRILKAAAFTILITFIASGSSSCGPGMDESTSEKTSAEYPAVPLDRACDSIIPKAAAVEVSSHLGTGEVREEKPGESIEEKAREAFKEGHDSDFTLVCRFYAEVDGEEMGMSVDFRRESGAPPNLRNSTPPWTIYRISNNTLLREKENITHLDVLCLTSEPPDGTRKGNTISLSMTEDMGVSIATKAGILAAAAEKVASGLECANDVSFSDTPEISPLPRK
jgi:hypothetical protein